MFQLMRLTSNHLQLKQGSPIINTRVDDHIDNEILYSIWHEYCFFIMLTVGRHYTNTYSVTDAEFIFNVQSCHNIHWWQMPSIFSPEKSVKQLTKTQLITVTVAAFVLYIFHLTANVCSKFQYTGYILWLLTKSLHNQMWKMTQTNAHTFASVKRQTN